jgi:hypothetical protein
MLVPALKWKVYDSGDNGWAIAVGNNLYIPVRDKSYHLGMYSYTMVQKTFRTKTRIGFGGYFFSKNVVAVEANRAGISANTYWYNTTIGLATLTRRFFVIIPMLAIAGNLGRKRSIPPSSGTFPVTTPLFSMLLISVIVIVSALTFFPVLSLGPVVEHLLMVAGHTF